MLGIQIKQRGTTSSTPSVLPRSNSSDPGKDGRQKEKASAEDDVVSQHPPGDSLASRRNRHNRPRGLYAQGESRDKTELSLRRVDIRLSFVILDCPKKVQGWGAVFHKI